MVDVSSYYALEAFECLEYNGYLSKDYDMNNRILMGSAVINSILDSRKFPRKMILGCIKRFSNNVFLSEKLASKLYSISEQVESLEINALQSFKDCGKELPEYMKRNTMTVGSGLYLAVEEKNGISFCHYCWFVPKIINDSKQVTLISSDNELMAGAMNNLAKLLKQYEN